jgi:hypothetical protein
MYTVGCHVELYQKVWNAVCTCWKLAGYYIQSAHGLRERMGHKLKCRNNELETYCCYSEYKARMTGDRKPLVNIDKSKGK